MTRPWWQFWVVTGLPLHFWLIVGVLLALVFAVPFGGILIGFLSDVIKDRRERRAGRLK